MSSFNSAMLGSAPMATQAIRRDGGRFVVGVSWLSAAAASLSFCVNLLFIEDRAALWTKNELDPLQRRVFVILILVAAALPAIASAAAAWRHSLKSVADQVWVWGHRAAPLVLLAPAVPLLDRESFIGQPITALSYMLLIGLAAAAIGTRCLEEGFASQPAATGEGAGWRVPATLTAAVCVGLFAHFAFYSVMRHHQMRSMSYDLAIFDNMMWHLTHGDWFASTPTFGPDGGNHLHRHTTFGAPLLVPFYAIWPRAETLLVLQAAFTATTPIPIFLLGRRLLNSPWLGFVFALCYALYAPCHGANFYDFHFLTMAAPLFAWVFYLLFTENTRALFVMTALTLGWREDTGAVLAFAGIVVWLWGVHPARTAKFVVVTALYFVLVKFVLMPLGGSHASFSDYYTKLQAPGSPGFWAVIETSLTNPFYVFAEVFGRKRLLYILHIFVPLLFFSLRDRRTWIAMIPGAVFTLMASRDPVYSIYFQYTAFWGPTAFLCAFLVLRSKFIDTARPKALVSNTAAILLTTFLTSFYFGSLFESPKMRGGFIAVSYEWTEEDQERLTVFRELAAEIPADASVATSSHECPHLSNRRYAYDLKDGYHDAEYLLVRDRHVRKKSGPGDTFQGAIDSGHYELMEKKGGFSLWRRTAAKALEP
jgi:uncharacterized membrane protein